MSRYYFAEELNDWSGASSSERPLLEVSVDGAVVLSDRVRSVGGRVSHLSLGDLVLSYCGGKQCRVLVKMDGAVVEDGVVFPQRLRMGVSAETFCQRNFLTLSSRDRYTHLNAPEQLSWVGDDVLTVTCYWWRDGDLVTSVHSAVSRVDGAVRTADVGGRQFSGVGELVGYRVVCGSREKRYHVVPKGSLLSVSGVLFRNGFGVMEYAMMTERADEVKGEMQGLRVGGELRNYDSEPNLRIHLSYLRMTASVDGVLGDMVHSRECSVLPGREPGVLTGVQGNFVDDHSALQWGEVLFRPHGAGVVLGGLGGGGVFDDSFDSSFE